MAIEIDPDSTTEINLQPEKYATRYVGVSVVLVLCVVIIGYISPLAAVALTIILVPIMAYVLFVTIAEMIEDAFTEESADQSTGEWQDGWEWK